MKFSVFAAASFALSATALPSIRRSSFTLANGEEAIAQKYVHWFYASAADIYFEYCTANSLRP